MTMVTLCIEKEWHNMATRGLVPRADGEGHVGTSNKKWGEGVFKKLNTEELSVYGKALLDLLYPVGSIKITVNDTAPFSDLSFGAWEEVGKGRVLWGADDTHKVGSTLNAGLPNITGQFGTGKSTGNVLFAADTQGAFTSLGTLQNNMTVTLGISQDRTPQIQFNASKSNSIYGGSDTVQPPAYVVHFWQRTA